MTGHDRDETFARYERGEISLETLAARTEMSVRQVLSELRERGVHLQDSEEGLCEDPPQRYGAFSESSPSISARRLMQPKITTL